MTLTAVVDKQTSRLARLTIGDGLLLLILLAASLLRLANLGQIPLSPAESTEALAVWTFWQPEALAAGATTTAVSSPAYFSLTVLFAAVFGFSDGLMRLVPALFGVATIALPWLLRQQLGAIGALFAAVLLTVSPLLTITARTAGGEAIAIFAAGLLLVAWQRHQPGNPNGPARWLTIGGAALGLGFASAPLFYALLVSLALATAVQQLLLSRFNDVSLALPNRAEWTRMGGTAVLVWLASSTLFLWHLPGLGAAAALPAQWLAQFGGWQTAALADPFLALARYESVLVLLGIVALLRTAWQPQDVAGGTLMYWTVALLILVLLQPGYMMLVAALTLPGYLLVARLASSAFVDGVDWLGLSVAGWLFVLGGALAVNLTRALRIITIQPDNLLPLWTAVFLLALILATLLYTGNYDGLVLAQASLLALVSLFAFYSWGTSWWLGHFAANDLRERWVTAATDDEIPLLAAALQDIGHQTRRAPDAITIVSTVESNVLRWYLRNFGRLTFVGAVPPTAQPDILITPEGAEPALASDYLGADYGHLRQCPERVVSATDLPLVDTLRWWLFQESAGCGQTERIIAWIRTDLVEAAP